MKTEYPTISINKESCIKCGKCAQVCPAGIMIQKKKGDEINLKYTDSCIACGHCVDVCPTDSVMHSLFPPDKLHTIDYTLLPTPEQVMLLIKSRRSNRAITSKPIPKETLDRIIEAAHYAPTATNRQEVSVTVITDPVKLRQISDFTIETLDSGIKKLMNPVIKCILKPFMKDLYASLPAFFRYKELHKAGKDPILRNATALLIFHTPTSSDFGCQDANLAYQNASLMAQSSGISQVYMGFVIKAINQGGNGSFSRITGIEGKIQAVMALGVPAFRYPKYTDR